MYPRRSLFKKAGILLLLIFPLTGMGQSANEEGSPPAFTNLNAGFGMLYGGLGANAEAGYGHFSGYGAFGYAPANSKDGTTIKASLNYQFGLRYYINVGSDMLFPRVGLGMGWVTNYYDSRIGTRAYDQHVNGLTLHLGAQVYSEEGFVFNFDLGLGSKYTLLNPTKHPFFRTVYFGPNVGIGYDMSRIFNKNSKQDRVKNREINPFE